MKFRPSEEKQIRKVLGLSLRGKIMGANYTHQGARRLFRSVYDLITQTQQETLLTPK